jgi:Kdo2-lipid IVA lauroyltransferase/acyltransferase
VPSGAFFRPLNNSLMNQMTIQRRQQSGTQLFSNKEGFMQSCSLLRDGGMLGILSDQNAGATGCLSPFFGRVTSCSPLAAVLHRRTGAKIFFVSIKRTRPAHWHIQITSHDSVTPVSTQSIMKGIEQALSSSPCDGFWFHNRWKTPRNQPFKIKNSRQSIDESGVTKPWRYVIVCSRNPSIAAASKPAIEHLMNLNQSDEFLLIHPPSMHAIANATSHALPEPDQLETLLRQLDLEKPYPIDMILYFCDDSMLLNSHKNTTIPMAAGMTYHKKHSFHIKITPPTSAVDDPQTWWYFIRSLGCDPSDFPS